MKNEKVGFNFLISHFKFLIFNYKIRQVMPV
jgi:hypothetical protein